MATPLIASLMQKAGGTAGIMGGARDAASDKKNDTDSKNLESIKKSSKKMVANSFIRTLGIGLGIFGLLRMSKGLSAVVSSFFQILGAFVDVIVAPFLPMIFKGLGKLSSFIPKVQTWAQGIFDTISTMEGSWLDKILMAIKLIWEGAKNSILQPLLEWLNTHIVTPFITTAPTWIGEQTTAIGKAVGNAVVAALAQSATNTITTPFTAAADLGKKAASFVADSVRDMGASINMINTIGSGRQQDVIDNANMDHHARTPSQLTILSQIFGSR